MQFSFQGPYMNTLLVAVICLLAALSLLIGCSDSTSPPPLPPDNPPTITLFEMDSTVLHVGTKVLFGIRASDDNGLDSAVLDFGDGFRWLFILDGLKHFAPFLERQYGDHGFFNTSLTVYDGKKQSAHQEIYVMVYPDSVPAPRTSLYMRRR